MNKNAVASAIEVIGEAFMELAFALRAEADQDDRPPTPIGAKDCTKKMVPDKTGEPEVTKPEDPEFGKKHTDGSRSGGQKVSKPKPKPEKAGETEDDIAEIPTEEATIRDDVILSDLQEIGAAMIKGGTRSKFLAVLADHGLKNLSSALPMIYGVLFKDLTEAQASE